MHSVDLHLCVSAVTCVRVMLMLLFIDASLTDAFIFQVCNELCISVLWCTQAQFIFSLVQFSACTKHIFEAPSSSDAFSYRRGGAAAACATMEKYMLGQTKAIVYISSTVRARGIFASIRNAMRWQRQNHCVLKDNGAMRRAQNAIKFSIYVFCRRRTASADIMCVYVPRTYTAKKSSSIHNFIKPNNQKTCEPINRSEKKRRTCAARVH